ncbi:MAG: class I adenylate-forming enzyme family protein, partial [Gemmatimonadota bacterium]|nr:class I adenylate-forming enzyme family protein [Gemmatimonadota bacterium]
IRASSSSPSSGPSTWAPFRCPPIRRRASGWRPGLRRLEHIATDAGTEVRVTSRRLLPIVGDLAGRAPSLRRIVTVSALSDGESAREGLEVGPDDPAFIQYTSGSTGRPRGVVVTHRNVVGNVHAIGQALRIRQDDGVMSSVSPLPRHGPRRRPALRGVLADPPHHPAAPSPSSGARGGG